MPQRPTVLIVDDDLIYLSVTASMVKKIGYPVMRARDGSEALSIFEIYEDEIGCILLDMQMPRLDGIQTLQLLRQKNLHVKVIIVSGYLTSNNREQLIPLSPLKLLEKPVSFEKLSDTLIQNLSGKKH